MASISVSKANRIKSRTTARRHYDQSSQDAAGTLITPSEPLSALPSCSSLSTRTLHSPPHSRYINNPLGIANTSFTGTSQSTQLSWSPKVILTRHQLSDPLLYLAFPALVTLSVATSAMPATLSPFRYIQLARYIVQWWLETAPGLQARRKAAQARAAQIIYAPRMRKPLAQPKKEEYVTAAAGGSSAALAFKPTSVDRFEGLHTETELEDMPPYPDKFPDPRYPPENMDIYRLMNDERAFLPGSTTPPKEIVVLCHGELDRALSIAAPHASCGAVGV